MTLRAGLAIVGAASCIGATAQVPVYDSAFTGYKAYVEPQVAPWKETNDKIGAAPGHAGHAMHTPKQAPAPVPKPAAVPAQPVKAKADPHAGHNH